MDYIELLNKRYACKSYDETKKVSLEDENIILEAARLSPSSFGLEPWKLVVIHDQALREKLKPACWNQPQITTCSFLVIILSRAPHNFRGATDYVKAQVARKDYPEEMQTNYLNMVGNFMMGVETNEWAKRQCYIALSNMLNAATSLGINSTPMEGFEPENITKILKEETNVNLDDFNVCVISAFGYRSDEQPVKVRAPKNEVIERI
ncbi:NAD(P)H-dependent oxidoreductase [Thiotrichales bacterium 19S11-10]|nr:NAD(P)H-dependent oxidoreductase [Thiotrichales bacterium 19S11-10]